MKSSSQFVCCCIVRPMDYIDSAFLECVRRPFHNADSNDFSWRCCWFDGDERTTLESELRAWRNKSQTKETTKHAAAFVDLMGKHAQFRRVRWERHRACNKCTHRLKFSDCKNVMLATTTSWSQLGTWPTSYLFIYLFDSPALSHIGFK